MRVTHLFPTYRNLGGVEAVLRGHWEHDAAHGIDSSFIILSETNDPPIDRIKFLGFNGSTTTKSARRAFAMAIEKLKPAVCVYHGAWLLKRLLDLDSAERRILQFHGAPSNYDQILRENVQWADGFAAISQPQFETMLRALPDVGRERMDRLACPIFPPQSQPIHQPLNGRSIILGYCGRLADDPKRADRAPAFVEALNQSGLDYRMEFLGDGPLESQLKEQFRGNSRVTFHGRKSGEAYWRILRNWDFFILFSDSEGTPISILETMDQGVFPVMPGINSGADYYAKQLGAEFVYPPYDFAKACETIRSLQSRPQTEIEAMRKRSRELVAAHHAENYFSSFAAFVNRIKSLPRRSSNSVPARPWPFDSLKFDWLVRLNDIRNRVKGSPSNLFADHGKFTSHLD